MHCHQKKSASIGKSCWWSWMVWAMICWPGSDPVNASTPSPVPTDLEYFLDHRAAITSFLTGTAPRQHGVTGWHMYLRELGAVLAILPGRPRYGGMSFAQAGVDVVKLLGHRPLFDQLRSRQRGRHTPAHRPV
jgi:hypothetical protein